MFRSLFNNTRALAIAAAVLGLSAGSALSVRAALADSWPNQCYNSDGSFSCPLCGGECLGGEYLCCNNGATVK